MRLRHFWPLAAIVFACVLFPLSAFGQDVPAAPTPVTALTPTTITVALLAALVAFLSNAYNTGSFFGLKTVPAAALPYFGVGLPFVSAVYLSISHAGALSGVALFNAGLAGFFALLGSGAGAGAHGTLKAHFNAHKAAAIASKVGTTLLLLVCFVSLPACGQGQIFGPGSPTWSKIESTILTDIENGEALSAIEAAVVAIDPSLASDAQGVDAIIQAAIDFLETVGAIPKANAIWADSVKAGAQVKVEAAKKTGAWHPSQKAQDIARHYSGRAARWAIALGPSQGGAL